MGLETGTYINSLVATNPLGTDAKSAGDDHIRLLKSTIKATFPNIAGEVTATHTQLNFVTGVTSAIQTQLDGKQAAGSYQPRDDQLTTLAGITAQQATDLASLSTFMGTVLNDTTADAAKATLEVGIQAKATNGYEATVTMPSTDFGRAVFYNSGSAGTLTLPDVTGNLGKIITIYNISVGVCTVARAGTSQIYAHGFNSTTSLTLNAGEGVQLFTDGVNWIQVGGGQIGAQSLASSGYKVLPGGLVLQWGSQTVAAATTSTYSFPLAFPTACFQFVAGMDIDAVNGNRNDQSGGKHISTTQYQLRQGAGTGPLTFHWFAVGY